MLKGYFKLQECPFNFKRPGRVFIHSLFPLCLLGVPHHYKEEPPAGNKNQGQK